MGFKRLLREKEGGRGTDETFLMNCQKSKLLWQSNRGLRRQSLQKGALKADIKSKPTKNRPEKQLKHFFLDSRQRVNICQRGGGRVRLIAFT